MAPKAADCKNVHNPNLQCKNDFLPYFDGFFLSLLKVYDHKIIFSWPLCIFGSKITKKNVSLIFYPKIPNPPPLRPLCIARQGQAADQRHHPSLFDPNAPSSQAPFQGQSPRSSRKASSPRR